VLLFEFFPLLVALVGVLAAIALYRADRRSRADPNHREDRPARPQPGAAEERPGRRPSMLP
jgi:hypothetical protein